jgi:hypothetical protein
VAGKNLGIHRRLEYNETEKAESQQSAVYHQTWDETLSIFRKYLGPDII